MKIIIEIISKHSEIIIGALIGLFCSLISQYAWWNIEHRKNKKQLAQAFYKEITSLEPKILSGQEYINESTKDEKSFLSQNWSHVPAIPIYKIGIFFNYQKEIFYFNRKLSNLIYDFYITLIRYESCCDLLFEIEKNREHYGKFFSVVLLGRLQYSGDCLQKIIELLPDLKRLLKSEV